MSMFHLLSLIGSGGGGAAPNLLPQIQAMFGGGEQGVVHDCTDLTTMFQERTGASATTSSGANGPIGSLKDLSPNNNWAVAPSDAARPLSRQGVGAPNVFGEWDGVNDVLRSSFVTAMPITIVASFGVITEAGAFATISSGVASNTESLLRTNATDALTLFSGALLSTASTFAVGQNIVGTALYNGASSRVAIDNGSYTSGNDGATVSSGVSLGANQIGGDPGNIRLFRYIKICRNLTDPEVAVCRNYCGAPIGLAFP